MIKLNSKQKRIFTILIGFAVLDFLLMIPPNAAASRNLAMVRMFEPDEAAQLTSLLNMLAPADGVLAVLKNFIFYKYYFYGFPFFAISALITLPLKLAGSLGDYGAVMLTLRQAVSVLPILIALLLLVYLQDGFRTYRSVVLFVFLLSVPAVLANHFWWHVDSLVFLMVVLVIYFLVKDDLRFGRHFLLAAALTGCATATKLIGLFFFLTIASLLLIAFVERKTPFKKLLKSGLLFIAVMVLAYFVSNPFLVSYWARLEYQMVLNKQLGFLSEGYNVIYQKGFWQSWPLIRRYYGEWFLLLVALGAVVWGVIKKSNRLLNIIILTWFLPLGIFVIWFTHYKYQYWLPIALPLLSCLVVLLPEKIELRGMHKNAFLTAAAALVLALQFGINIHAGINAYTQRVKRADDNAVIAFYDQALVALEELPDQPLKVYFDYRLYVPETRQWTLETNYDLLSYNFVQEQDYDVLLLLQQRIADYINPQISGINSQQFANSQAFYADANRGDLHGYILAFRNETGLVFVKEGISNTSF